MAFFYSALLRNAKRPKKTRVKQVQETNRNEKVYASGLIISFRFRTTAKALSTPGRR
jgi:hypothetical protein